MKRFNFEVPLGEAPLDGKYARGIVSRNIGAKFAKIVTTFEHLEIEMASVLAVLLNDHHAGTAGYILRAIIAPKAKKELLVHLLEKSPENQNLPIEFDKIIREYSSISSKRNDLVHGKWYTLLGEDPQFDTNRRVFLCIYNEHGSSWMDTREISEGELDELFQRMLTLFEQIEQVVSPILVERSRSVGSPGDQTGNAFAKSSMQEKN